MVKLFKKFPFELVIWLLGLILLFNLDLKKESFSLCPIHGLGFSWCPGCGIGRSISLFMHGQFEASFAMHWFGIPAFLILVFRIFILLKDYLQQFTPINGKH